MASKVNTKFILSLSAGLLVVFAGAAYIGYQSIKKSGDDYIKMGDKAVAEQKYSEAIGLYGKAVFKDQRNAAWIAKWLGAMEKDTPKGRAVYTEAYMGQYRRAIQALAEADRTNFEANRRAIDEPWQLLQLGGFRLDELEAFIQMVESNVKAFQGDANKAKQLWRYRGLARVAMLSVNPEMKQEELDKARKDLDESLAVAPDDKDALFGVVTIDMNEAARAYKRDDKPTARQKMETAAARLSKFITDYPPASAARAALIRVEINSAANEAGKSVTMQDVLQDATRRAKVEELVTAFLAEKPEKIEPGVLVDASTYARAALAHPRSNEAPAQMFEHAIKSRPDDAMILLMGARYAREQGDMNRSFEYLQRVIDLPDLPMSIRGLSLFGQRIQAVRDQTDTALMAWESEKDLAKKAAAAEQVKKFRDDLVTRVGESSNEVLAVDARLAFIKGDVKGATTLITRYNQQTKETDASAMALQATLMLQQGNVGAAKQSFERILQLPREGLNIRVLMALCKIATDSGDFAEAYRYASTLKSLQPDNKGFIEQERALGDLVSGKIDDPVMRVIQKAYQQTLGVDADPKKALQILREGMAQGKNADDFKMHVALIQQLVRMNDKPGAIEAINVAMAKFPAGNMHEQLAKTKESLETTDPVAAAIARIDAANAPELAKFVGKYLVYAQYDRADEGKPFLDQAVALAPEDPQVLDARFDYGLRKQDRAELGKLTELAEAKNLDQVNGQFYRARLLFVDGKMAESAQALRGVVERDRLNFQAWRMLGIVNVKLENFEAAADAYGKALSIRGNDIQSATGYVRSLAASKRIAEALAEARKFEKFAAGDAEFSELYLRLLSTSDPDKARELRETLAKIHPENKANKIDLAILQMQQRRWDDAKVSIDALRTDDSLKDAVVELDARWFAMQGKFAEAEKVFDDAIKALPADKISEVPFVSAAELFNQLGQPDRAVVFLEKGRPHQKPDTMYIDRTLGDVQFGARRMPEAFAAYKRVLDAGSKDENSAVANRLLECLLHQKDYAKFDEMLAAMGERARKDSTLLVLAAEAAGAQGDNARAATLLDQAVASDQKNWLVYMKRGAFSLNDPAKLRDAIADFEQASRINPNATQPLLRLFDIYATTGKIDKAMEHLHKALALDPTNDTLRVRLIELHANRNEESQMVDLVDQAIKLKPDAIEWQLQGGELMSRMGRFDRAADYGKMAWEKQKTLRAAIPYVTALLNKTPMDKDTARTVVLDPALEKEDEMPRRVLRALFQSKVGDTARADSEMGQALAKLDQNVTTQVDLFAAGLETVYGAPNDQLAAFNRIKGQTNITSWMEVQIELLKLRDPSTAAAAAAKLEAIAAAATDDVKKVSIFNILSSYNMQAGNFEKVITFCDKLLALKPEDLGSLNNSAYILATKLDRPADALPRAEKAAEIAPDNGTILDTLGATHLRLKNHQKAVEVLSRAVDISTAPADLVPALTHLGKAYLGLGKKTEAQKTLDRAKQILEATPGLEPQFGSELKEGYALLDAQ